LCSPEKLLLLDAPWRSRKSDEVEHGNDDHDRADQPDNAVHDLLLLMSEN
jgi:hypothetical protein